MKRQMELDDLTLEILTQLRQDDRMTFAEIGALVGVSQYTIRKRAEQLGLPRELFVAQGRRAEVRRRIAAVDDGSRTAMMIAQDFGCNEGQVRQARRDFGIRGRCRGMQDKRRKLSLCTRCDMPAWEGRNIIFPDGLCLWCHIELAGLSLAALVQEYGWKALLEAAAG